MTVIQIVKSSPYSPAAKKLMGELSTKLHGITGDDGSSSFQDSDLDSPRSVFLLLTVDGSATACGALRKVSEEVCEIKRMYSKESGKGFGKRVLQELEKSALEFGYREIWLSTRKINRRAVEFYLRNGYDYAEKYGKYQYTDKSVCLAKKITNSEPVGE